jgi:hypothetical protein
MPKEFAFIHAGRRFHCYQQGSEADAGRWVCDAAGVAFDVGAAAELPDRAAVEVAAIKAFDATRAPD